MAPRKLSDSDKGTIVELYKQPGQTTSTLAAQYGVSNSTISRILKMSIPSEEYRALVSKKRMGGGSADSSSADKKSADKKETASGSKRKRRSSRKADDDSSADEALPADPVADQRVAAESADGQPDKTDAEERLGVARPKLKTAAEKAAAKSKSSRSSTRRRRGRSAISENAAQTAEQDEQLPLLSTEDDPDETIVSQPTASQPTASQLDSLSVSQLLEEEDDEDDDDDLAGLDETLGDDFGDDDDDDLDEDDLDDDDLDDGDDETTPKPKLQAEAMQIMPLADAVLPKPCYLVVDMRAELITRPLVEFADLGQIPSEEERAKTLPVFDNHRVARRFSRNKQRVIKVPDGSLITRTSPYLAAKGITRLLVDGQVFDLVGAGADA